MNPAVHLPVSEGVPESHDIHDTIPCPPPCFSDDEEGSAVRPILGTEIDLTASWLDED
jgi:hypothetical protein